MGTLALCCYWLRYSLSCVCVRCGACSPGTRVPLCLTLSCRQPLRPGLAGEGGGRRCSALAGAVVGVPVSPSGSDWVRVGPTVSWSFLAFLSCELGDSVRRQCRGTTPHYSVAAGRSSESLFTRPIWVQRDSHGVQAASSPSPVLVWGFHPGTLASF